MATSQPKRSRVSWTKREPGHGLDDRADLLAVAQDAIGEGAQGVRVWVNG
jgi:hypothetical protein